jgi:ribonuclease-3
MVVTSHEQDDVSQRLRALLARLDVHVDDLNLFVQAVTHRSWAFENDSDSTNERLEFLGDAVVGLVVTDQLYVMFPDEAEGVLAKLRAAAVRAESLATLARDLDIGDAVLLGYGETKSNGAAKESILADTFEAVIGAVYLDQGFATAYDLVERLFAPLLPTLLSQGVALDYKTSLQELAAKMFGELPRYTLEATGPEHQKDFVAEVWLADTCYGRGAATSKKQAEQRAAEAAYHALKGLAVPHESRHAD